jgi:hypothetical protein
MSRLLILSVLALVACKKKAAQLGEECGGKTSCAYPLHCVDERCTAGVAGDRCMHTQQCQSGTDCVDGTCRPPGTAGQTCANGAHCATGLKCRNTWCITSEEFAQFEQKEKDALQAQAAAKEQQILRQAGVDAPAVAEVPVATPPGPGTRVRTVTIAAEGTTFAPCKTDERLVGGGCKATKLEASYPSGQSAEDTVGARWNCVGEARREVVAYALCSKL